MTIKIYHNIDGSVKISKIAPTGLEQPIYSNLKEGQVATLDITVANLALEGNLDIIDGPTSERIHYDTRSSH